LFLLVFYYHNLVFSFLSFCFCFCLWKSVSLFSCNVYQKEKICGCIINDNRYYLSIYWLSS
jgi:hypothetical protein